MRIADMTWMQVEAYLQEDDRCVLPLGSTEQHAYVSLATDSILAERVAVEAAEPVGVPVFPALAYGITPYFMAYPGTVTISVTTYERVLTEVLGSLRRHGFRRIVVVNGHGGNSPVRPTVESWAAAKEGLTLRWHDWWKAPGTRAVIDEIDPDASHASWMETFPWTTVDGVGLPDRHKEPVDLSERDGVSLSALRETLGDGSFGGDYHRSEEETMRVWRTAVSETRSQLIEGW